MIATVLAGLGEKEQAFEFLERAYQQRSSDLLYVLRVDARIDSLRSDVRVEQLMRRMNRGPWSLPSKHLRSGETKGIPVSRDLDGARGHEHSNQARDFSSAECS
jgi:hypothetical protein